MSRKNNDEIKVRVPEAMKSALETLANEHDQSLAACARKALYEHLERNGISRGSLRENPPEYKTDQASSKTSVDVAAGNVIAAGGKDLSAATSGRRKSSGKPKPL